jgi:hypothetical protein
MQSSRKSISKEISNNTKKITSANPHPPFQNTPRVANPRDGEAPAKPTTISVVYSDKTPITPSNHHPMHKTHNTTILPIQNILTIQIQTKKPTGTVRLLPN